METETKKVDAKKLLITLFIILLTAGAVGGGVYYVLNQNFQKEREANEKALNDLKNQVKAPSEEKSTKAGTNSTSQAKDETSDWKSYNNETWGISFKYPTSYTIVKNSVQQPGSMMAGDLWLEDKVRAGSPKLYLSFNPNGIGGCMLDNNDYSYTTAINNGKIEILDKTVDVNSPCEYSPEVKTMFSIGKGNYQGTFQNTIFGQFIYEVDRNYQTELDKIFGTIKITKNEIYGR